jgi:hypothetical protein
MLVEMAEREDWTLLDFDLLTVEEIGKSVVALAREFDGLVDVRRPELEGAAGASAQDLVERMFPRGGETFGGRVLLLWPSSPPAAVGPGSFHHEILERVGGVPAIEEGSAYIELDAEDVLGLAPDGIVLIAARELAIGATVGLVAAVPLMAAGMAGRLVDFAGAARGTYGALFSIVAAAVFFGIDGHVAAVAAIGESFRAVPVSAVTGAREAVGGLIGAAVKLAIPWLVTAAVVEIAVGVGVRVAGRSALQAPVGAAVPATIAMMTAALVGTFAVGVAALVR